jgi:hypothetical protein
MSRSYLHITQVKQDRRRTLPWLFAIRRDGLEFIFDYWTEEEAKAERNLALRVLEATGVDYKELAASKIVIEV